jgi:hypothetical protein
MKAPLGVARHVIPAWSIRQAHIGVFVCHQDGANVSCRPIRFGMSGAHWKSVALQVTWLLDRAPLSRSPAAVDTSKLKKA